MYFLALHRILTLLRTARVAFLFPHAFMLFTKKKYNKAIGLFEKICKIESKLPSDLAVLEITYFCLGRSYLAIGQYNKALEVFSHAYELYHQKSLKLESLSEQEDFLEFLDAYRKTLQSVGQEERAKDIEREMKEYITSMKTKNKWFKDKEV